MSSRKMVFVDKFGLREPSRNCGRGLAFSPDQEQEQDRLGPDTVSKSYTIIFAILIETRIFTSTRASHKSHSQFSFSKPISLNSNDFQDEDTVADFYLQPLQNNGYLYSNHSPDRTGGPASRGSGAAPPVLLSRINLLLSKEHPNLGIHSSYAGIFLF